MAIRNEVSVYINGVNYTSRLVIPYKYGAFLDERLDEMTISLRRIKKEDFPPFSTAEMVIKQTEYFGEWNSPNVVKVKTQTTTKRFFVADDNGKEVTPATGVYDHELYLLEPTKILERIVMDSLTETNALGKDYTDDTLSYAEPIFE